MARAIEAEGEAALPDPRVDMELALSWGRRRVVLGADREVPPELEEALGIVVNGGSV
jgi:hypothetical protein